MWGNNLLLAYLQMFLNGDFFMGQSSLLNIFNNFIKLNYYKTH